MRWSGRSGLVAAAIAGSLLAAAPAFASDDALQFNGASPGRRAGLHGLQGAQRQTLKLGQSNTLMDG